MLMHECVSASVCEKKYLIRRYIYNWVEVIIITYFCYDSSAE